MKFSPFKFWLVSLWVLAVISVTLATAVVAEESVADSQTSACDSITFPDVALGEEARLDEVTVVLEKLKSENFVERVEAGIRLRQIATAKETPRLVALLKQGNPEDVQLSIIYALAKTKDTRASQALSFELDYGSQASKRAALIALGEIGTDWPIGILYKTIRDNKDPDLRRIAASALGRVRTDGAVHALNSVASFRDRTFSEAVDWALLYANGKLDELPTSNEFPGGYREHFDKKGPAYYYYHGVKFYFYQPALRLKSDPPPWMLVGLHYRSMNAEQTFNDLFPIAKEQNLSLLVPVFDNMKFPEFQNFNIYGTRADKCLLEIIDHVAKAANLQAKQLYMYGMEGGGDFAQRFAMTYPERVARAVYAPEEFIEVDDGRYFPAGTELSPLTKDVVIDLNKFTMTDSMIFGVDAQDQIAKGVTRFFGDIDRRAKINGVQNRILTTKISSLGEKNTVLFWMKKYFFEWRPAVIRR